LVAGLKKALNFQPTIYSRWFLFVLCAKEKQRERIILNLFCLGLKPLHHPTFGKE
jgi:hypothetical protein